MRVSVLYDAMYEALKYAAQGALETRSTVCLVSAALLLRNLLALPKEEERIEIRRKLLEEFPLGEMLDETSIGARPVWVQSLSPERLDLLPPEIFEPSRCAALYTNSSVLGCPFTVSARDGSINVASTTALPLCRWPLGFEEDMAAGSLGSQKMEMIRQYHVLMAEVVKLQDYDVSDCFLALWWSAVGISYCSY